METTLMQLISVLSAIVVSMGGTPVSTSGVGEVVAPVPTALPVHLENGLFVDQAGNPVSLSALYNACTNDVGIELPKC